MLKIAQALELDRGVVLSLSVSLVVGPARLRSHVGAPGAEAGRHEGRLDGGGGVHGGVGGLLGCDAHNF